MFLATGHYSLLLSLVFEMIWPMCQNWSAKLYCGLCLSPLDFFLFHWFLYCSKEFDKPGFTISKFFELCLRFEMNCLVNGILLYVGLNPWFSIHGDTPIGMRSFLAYTNSELGNCSCQFNRWEGLEWCPYWSTSFFNNFSLPTSSGVIHCQQV